MIRSWKSRTKTWERATSEQKKLWLAGINPRYWDVSLDDTKPDAFVVDRKYGKTANVTASKQLQIIEQLKAEPNRMRYNTRIGIGSEPTEELGISFAFALARHAIANDLETAILDLGTIPARNYSNYSGSAAEAEHYSRIRDAHVLVIHNLTNESTPERIQAGRDWLKRYAGKFCIFVVAGIDPITFADDKLRLPLDACFMFEGRRKINVREV